MNPIQRYRSRRRALARRFVSILALGIALLSAIAQEPAGQPPSSGMDPARQAEHDWIDNRWSKTQVGQFLASNLVIPGSRAKKPLSIKVGAGDEGAVCFDTSDCVLRAGWTGGFLEFDPSRFGLIRAPKMAGIPAFVVPPGPGWEQAQTRYTGLHQNGKRIVLEYTVNHAQVLESPWLETNGGVTVFTRSFEIAPLETELKLIVASASGDVKIDGSTSQSRVTISKSGNSLVALAIGPGLALDALNGKLRVRFPASRDKQRCKLILWSGENAALGSFKEFAKTAAGAENLTPILRPGPARWLPELKTTGKRGLDVDILAVDTLTVPYDNPWKALMFLTGVDFTGDGAAYVCTVHGDVWRVTGIDQGLRELRWKRFATGLFQPLGLSVREGKVYVLGRDQITCLHDLNEDGEADFYENFCNLTETSPSSHEFVTCLEKDDAGRFYFTDPRGVHRVARDGLSMEALATGFRNPNGLGVSHDGKILTVSPQQGEWTPSSVICEIKAGAYYGYGGPKITAERPLGYDAPLCWIPHSVDNSSASQVWVPENHWGPLSGGILHLRWGGCGMMLLMRDVAGGVPQGAVVELPGRFLSGPHRGSFNPLDGHLYIAGSTGWQTSAVKDGCLQRVRFTGKPVFLPVGWHARANGLEVAFSQKLEPGVAQDLGSYSVHQWNYRYAAQYGSKDWSVAEPEKEGRDEVEVKSARLLADGKTVFLEMAGLRPVMQMQIEYNLNSADGMKARSKVWLTLNKFDEPRHF